MAEPYPPARHIMRDLRIVTDRPAPEHAISVAPVDDHVRDASGGACLGFLVALVDTCGALVALPAAEPDWMATSSLSYQAIAPLRSGPAIAEAHLLRRGSKTIVCAVEVFDGDGSEAPGSRRPVGSGLLNFGRIPRRASESVIDTSAGFQRHVTMALPDSGLTAPLLERVGIRVRDAAAGDVELHKSDYVRNSFGTINGGVLGMVAQAAAEAAVAASTEGPTFVAADIQLHYLAQVGAGPLRTSTRVLRRVGEHAVCHVHAFDAGNADLAVTFAQVTLLAW